MGNCPFFSEDGKETVFMGKRAGLILFCVLLGGTFATGQGQKPAVALSKLVDPAPPAGANDPVIRESFKFVAVRAAVMDKTGHIVNGLQPSDFRLYDNGRPQVITADIASQPLSVVVAIQSAAGVEKILPDVRKLSTAFETFVLGETGELALISFDD